MSGYSYEALDVRGKPVRGRIQVNSQTEALRRIKEMGFHPVKLSEAAQKELGPAARVLRHGKRLSLKSNPGRAQKIRGRIKAGQLAGFTRQLATLLDAGMPLLRGLQLLREQEECRALKQVIADLCLGVEGGSALSESLSRHPRVFDRLYLNMVRAGELGGALENSLNQIANHMEKAVRIRGKVKAAMFYPAAVMTVAAGVMSLMLLFVVPRFKAVFADLSPGGQLPGFTRFVLHVSDSALRHAPVAAIFLVCAIVLFLIGIRTRAGRELFDLFKLRAPVFGPVFRKAAIARFSRTFATLAMSGVPILRALEIVKEASGNVIIGQLAGRVRRNVEQGESIAGPLRESRIFPAVVAGMVDVGEQTGALPEMLNKVADNYEQEVDNAVTAMTSLMEPILIVILGLVVGSIVIAMFLPIINFHPDAISPPGQ